MEFFRFVLICVWNLCTRPIKYQYKRLANRKTRRFVISFALRFAHHFNRIRHTEQKHHRCDSKKKNYHQTSAKYTKATSWNHNRICRLKLRTCRRCLNWRLIICRHINGRQRKRNFSRLPVYRQCSFRGRNGHLCFWRRGVGAIDVWNALICWFAFRFERLNCPGFCRG